MPLSEKAVQVLLVEDNAYDAEAVSALFDGLKGGPFRLRAAGSLGAAKDLDKLEPADVVLLDLNLPDSYGADTLVRAKLLFKDRPIIVMTGMREEKLGLQLIKKGAQDYMVKGKITGEWLGYSISYAIERARIDQKAREREARLKEMFEKIPEGFLVVRADRSVLFANRGAERLLARRREDLLSRKLDLKCSLEGPVETDFHRPDGRTVPAEVRAAEIHWGGETCRLVMLRDISAARMLDRAREEFISRISHELRSPLTVVRESLQMICDGTAGEPSEKQREIARMGLDNCSRLNRMIDALMDLTKIEAGVMPVTLEGSDLRELCSATVSDYLHLASDRGIRLAAELGGTPALTFCDREKIAEVLINLVSNALKFTPRGGDIRLSLETSGEESRICVQNSGEGLDPEDIPKLFRKFSRVKGPAGAGAEGTGLGLAISRGIVELHLGRIWAESEKGSYARFCLSLPRLDFCSALRLAVRREIEAAKDKREFSALTLTVPAALRSGRGAPDLDGRIDAFVRSRLRNYHAMIKRGPGEFTVLLADCGLKECGKTMALLQAELRALYGPSAEDAWSITTLVYPEDFADEDSLAGKLRCGGRGGQ